MQKILLSLLFLLGVSALSAQSGVTLPAQGFNLKSSASQRIGITDVTIRWNAPGVKGREGKIWGTTVAHYGFQNLGFGTAKESPWRAGADENTTITFSTDVTIEGKWLSAGTYGFHIALAADSSVLIFTNNNTAWGSYFYDPAQDALRITVRQQKNMPENREWLTYEFSDQTANSAVVALRWERWRIPFRISVDVPKLTMASLRRELQGEKGFYDENWQAAAQFALQNNLNLEEALTWADNAINPPFGNQTFTNLAMKAQILEKLGRGAEAAPVMKTAMEKGNLLELHGYGRQLLTEKKPAQALEVFQTNFKRNGDAWPTHVGLARGYSATGDLKKALEHAKLAQKQAPDDINRQSLEAMVKTLSDGKALTQ